MIIIENILKGNFDILYSKKVKSFILHYDAKDKVSYFPSEQFSTEELNNAILKASNIGKCFDDLSHTSIKHKINKEDTREVKKEIIDSFKIKESVISYKMLLNTLNKIHYSDIDLCYKIYTNLCQLYDLTIKLDEPIKEIKTNFGYDLIDNSKQPGYKKELEMELSNILNKIKSKELELNVEIFYKNYFENLLLSLMINGDFKKCSIELRNFKRSITNFCNKYSCPCFIHIPQKIKIDYNDKKYSFKNKLMLYIYPYQKEYSQFSKFNSNNIEKTISNRYQLKNEILLNVENVYNDIEKKKQDYLITELNININPFIYTCFWLHRLIPISNKYVKKDYGRIKEEDYFAKKIDDYFGKSSNSENYLSLFKSEIENINQRIKKETSFCNYTKLNETIQTNISFTSDIENYNVETFIYSNITLCIWNLFYNNYFLKLFFDTSKNKSISKFTCIKCNKDIIGKKHSLRNINSNNKYNILPYLCENCMKERNKKSGVKRITQYRNK